METNNITKEALEQLGFENVVDKNHFILAIDRGENSKIKLLVELFTDSEGNRIQLPPFNRTQQVILKGINMKGVKDLDGIKTLIRLIEDNE